MSEPVELRLGVKTDPIEYRYSHKWLFNLLASEGIKYVQIGTHFELYQLPDAFFHDLKKEADDAGVVIDSMFTAHRELGGFFRTEPGYEQVARKNFERYIQVGGLLGVKSEGSNPGAVMRDQMSFKDQGVECYIRHMKELMHHAHDCGVEWLTIEPMSCLAEPPTLPEEVIAMGKELTEYHNANPNTAQVGFCADIAHGYVNQNEEIVHDHFGLFDATLPYLYEVHLKNTDSMYNSTFGFTENERLKGIIQVPEFRTRIVDNSETLPVKELGGYLEIGGPKLGRDYSDYRLEASLRESLRYLKKAFLEGTSPPTSPDSPSGTWLSEPAEPVIIAPSMMCVDPLNFEANLRLVESQDVGMLHMDIMDARFVPNMPMGLGILEKLRSKTDLPIDVHLMVEDNDFFIELMKDMGVDQISVHVESCVHTDRTLAKIREIGAKAGLAINPATPLSAVEYLLERIDYVLLMTVNPGYAGQKMTPASIRKIEDCRKMLDESGYEDTPIQVDGNVSFENIPPMVAAGAANLVAGTSSIFHKDASMAENISKMKAGMTQGLIARKG